MGIDGDATLEHELIVADLRLDQRGLAEALTLTGLFAQLFKFLGEG